MRWNILSPDPELVTTLQDQFLTTPIIARVLANRGINSLAQSRTFFNPHPDQFHDPFLMKDMDLAVNRILKNYRAKKPILIFGDYDVDGTSSASLLYLGFQFLGINVETYIPNRETEGYGLSREGIDFARSIKADLLVTCDCGINAFEKVDYANTQGLDVIITDHHIPEKVLPSAFAILNPKRRDCKYPFKGLCGCGVAFKLLSAVTGKLAKNSDHLMGYLDLVALATSADMVPILDENRVMVHYGLAQLETTDKPGLKYLMEKSNLDGKEMNVGRLVFGIAPKLNAAGRLGDANRTVKLLTTRDETLARKLAATLVMENKRRQKIQEAVVDEAICMVNAQVDLERDKAIVIGSKGWHPGVIGIVASRIKDEFSRPTVIIAFDEDGLGKGSARSIKPLDMYEAFSHVSSFLEGFGGHPMAAGLTILEENMDDFRRNFLMFANRRLIPNDLIPTITLDGEMSLKDIDPRFMGFLHKLGPYGPGNMRPKFISRGVEIVGNPRIIGKGGHIRFSARQDDRTYPAIGFNLAHFYENLILGKKVDLAYVVETNEWQGKTSIQLNIRDIKISGSNTG